MLEELLKELPELTKQRALTIEFWYVPQSGFLGALNYAGGRETTWNYHATVDDVLIALQQMAINLGKER